jgi:Fur family peroxide stress response transcriptional regulator
MRVLMDKDRALRVLRESGMRLTPQRRAVIDALSGDTTHPFAEDVASRVASTMPGVSLSTVYKTLHEFAALGLIHELGSSGAMRFDAEPEPHAHVECPICHAVEDFDPPPAALRQLSRAAGVDDEDVFVTLHAPCESCAHATVH